VNVILLAKMMYNCNSQIFTYRAPLYPCHTGVIEQYIFLKGALTEREAVTVTKFWKIYKNKVRPQLLWLGVFQWY